MSNHIKINVEFSNGRQIVLTLPNGKTLHLFQGVPRVSIHNAQYILREVYGTNTMCHLEDKKRYFSIPGVDKKFEYTSPAIDWEGDVDDIIEGVVSVLRDLRAISKEINQFKEEQTKRTWVFPVD